jgi:hypothetical protein
MMMKTPPNMAVNFSITQSNTPNNQPVAKKSDLNSVNPIENQTTNKIARDPKSPIQTTLRKDLSDSWPKASKKADII